MDALEPVTSLLPSIDQIGRGLSAFLPRAGVAAAIVAVGLVTARLGRVGSSGIMNRVLARLVRRPGGGAALERHASDLFGTLVFWSILFVAGMFATEVIGLPVVSTWLGALTAYLPRVLVAAGVMLASILAGRFLEDLAVRMASSVGLRHADRVGRMVRGLALAFGAVIAVQQLGVDVSILTTVVLVLLGGAVAAAALAFGLGGQTVVANILVMHYVRRTFRSGDLLKVGEFEGRLVRTTPLAVVLEQEGREIVVPAQRFISEVTHRIPDSEV